jgi:prevent-host-death family protein
MTVVTIHKAKTDLSELIRRAEAGEEVIIARGTTPVVGLKPLAPPKIEEQKRPRQPGSMAHLLGAVPDDAWFEPLPDDELSLWEGGD